MVLGHTTAKRFRRTREVLERQLAGEPDLPFAAVRSATPVDVDRAGDHTEVGVRDVAARIGEMRRVGGAEHFHPELELDALGDGEVAENADIQVEETRSPDGVASHRAEADLTRRNGAECRVVEVMTRRVVGGAGSARLSEHLCGADATTDTKWADLIRCLEISR